MTSIPMRAGGMTWGQMLQSVHAKRIPRLTDRELADRCGVPVDELLAWKRDEEAPVGSALARLYGSLPTMKGHVALLNTLREQLRQRPKTPKTAQVIQLHAHEEAPEEQYEAEEAEEAEEEEEPEPVPVPEPPPPAQALVPYRKPTQTNLPVDRFAGLSFGAALRRFREELKCSQGELGALLGAAQTTISCWEMGYSEPNEDTRREIDKAIPELRGLKVVLRPRPQETTKETTKEAPMPEQPPAPPPTAPAAPSDPRAWLGRWVRLTNQLKRVEASDDLVELLQLAKEAGLSVDDVLQALDG